MAEKRPACPLYAKDYIAATRGLSLAARGAYIDLILFSWINEGNPTDEDELRQMVGADRAEWRKVWPRISGKWEERDGRLYNRRLEAVREDTTAFTEAKASAGKASARARLTRTGSAQPPSKPRTQPEQTPNTAPNENPTAPEPSVAVPSSLLPKPSGLVSESAHTHPSAPAKVFTFDPNDPGPSPTNRRRPQATWEGRALYVTHQQHRDFVGRLTLGGMAEHQADAELRRWYVATEDALRASGTVPGANILRFWDDQFAARPDVTAVTAKPVKPSVADHNARMAAELAARAVAHG